MATELRAAEPELSPFEASFAADTSYDPSLDMPMEAQTVATTQEATLPRGPDGRFLPRAHDAGTVALARELGFTDERIQGTAPDTLREIVSEVQRRELALLREQRSQLGSGIRPPQEPSRAQPAPEPEPEINWDDYEPALARYLKRKDEEIKSLKAELGKQEQTRQLSAEEQRLDRLFEQVNRPDLYGKGGAAGIDKKSKEWRKRCAAVAEAGGVGNAKLAGVLQATSDLFGAAAGPDNAYASDEPARPRSELDQRKQDWRDGTLATPSHRQPQRASADLRAARKVHDILTENPRMLADPEDDLP